jgi:proteasome regulatory subunit
MVEDKLQNIAYTYITQMGDLEEENKFLKESLLNMEKEMEKFKKPPLISCEIKDTTKDEALVKLPNGNEFLVNISATCEKPLLPGDTVLAEQKNLTIIKKINSKKIFDVEKFVIIEKPKITWESIGGLEKQRNELHEVIELPLKNPGLFKKIGIEPPKGILLHGPPGTGKTLLAKAVASSTESTFIEVVASELVQKFIGEGAKLVKEIFQLAREKAPSIIFIDEIDAIAATRIEIGTSGEREVQRTFMQLLSEIDGFKSLGNVKIVGCTNRKDVLDPAILRPGRLDRLIQVPIPNKEGKKEIFKIHTKNMKTEKINIDKLVNQMENFSGAEIKATATEAGYFAIREKRTKIDEKDFLDAIKKVKQEIEEDTEHLKMFG